MLPYTGGPPATGRGDHAIAETRDELAGREVGVAVIDDESGAAADRD